MKKKPKEFICLWEIDGVIYNEPPEKFIEDVVAAIIAAQKPVLKKAE